MKFPADGKKMKKTLKKHKWTEGADDKWDKKRGIKENSPKDKMIDKSRGLAKKNKKKLKSKKKK